MRSKRSSNSDIADNEEPEVSGRVAGTVRRYMPPDTRDPPGAILHFYVGDSYDPNRFLEIPHFWLIIVECFTSSYWMKLSLLWLVDSKVSIHFLLMSPFCCMDNIFPARLIMIIL